MWPLLVFLNYVRSFLPIIFVARLYPQIPHTFCMRTFSASLTNFTVLLPQSHDCSCSVSRQTPASPLLWLQKHTGLRAHNLANFPKFDISLGLLTFPGPESRDILELILLLTPVIIRTPLLEIRWTCDRLFPIIFNNSLRVTCVNWCIVCRNDRSSSNRKVSLLSDSQAKINASWNFQISSKLIWDFCLMQYRASRIDWHFFRC
jgi:hypothetical protein